VVHNVTEGCFLAPFGAGAVAINSLGSNVFTDGTCFPIGSDQIVPNVPGTVIGPLANYGGPTQTHTLVPDGPAIDSADDAFCPVVDQRGVARPVGPACDVGAFEYEP
jgi:hypothetical protein